jgi:hypothetical protein
MPSLTAVWIYGNAAHLLYQVQELTPQTAGSITEQLQAAQYLDK